MTAELAPSERSLQSVVAEPWLKVSVKPMLLEGPAFERNRTLLFRDLSCGRVLRVTPDKQLYTVIRLSGVASGGMAIHKDGASS